LYIIGDGKRETDIFPGEMACTCIVDSDSKRHRITDALLLLKPLLIIHGDGNVIKPTDRQTSRAGHVTRINRK